MAAAYSLKDFVARHPLPKNVCVEDGFYADRDEGTLSAGQIITLHTKKRTDKLRATLKRTEDGAEASSTVLFIPLNCGEKVKILPSVGREIYDNISDLLQDSPPLVRVLHNIPWLHLLAGDILRPAQHILQEGRRNKFLVCEFLYDRSRGHVNIPVDYGIAFEALATPDVYFLREVVERFPLPVTVRFVSESTSGMASSSVGEVTRLAGVVTLEERIAEETIIASSYMENTVVVLNISVDLDVTVTAEPDPTPGDRSYARFCNFMHDGAKLERFSDWINQVRQHLTTVETIDEYEDIAPRLPPRTHHDGEEVDESDAEAGRTCADKTDGQDAIEMDCHFEPPPRPPKPPRPSNASRESLRQDPDGQEDETGFQRREQGAEDFHDDSEAESDKDVYEPWEALPEADFPSHQGCLPPLPPKRSTSLRDNEPDESNPIDETPPTIWDKDDEYLLPADMPEFPTPSSVHNIVDLSPRLTVDSSDEDVHDYFEIDNNVKPPSRTKKTLMKLFGGIKRKLSSRSNSTEELDADDAEGTKPSDSGGSYFSDGGGGDYDDDDYDDDGVAAAAAAHNVFPSTNSPAEYHKPTKDISVSELGNWLRKLNMEQHAHRFEKEQIDGYLLCGLTEDELHDLGVTGALDVKKITKFTEGWRPNAGLMQ